MKFLVADGNFLLHRAWNTAGKTSAVPTIKVPKLILNWFCSTALKLNCDGGLLALDGSDNFRYGVYQGYKAARSGVHHTVEDGPLAGKSQHDAVYASLQPTKVLFKALGIRVVQMKRYEADDVLISVADKIGKKQGNHVYLLTLDKDMVQAVTDQVSIFYPEMQNRPEKIVTVADVKILKHGLTPRQFLDLQILMGDGVDGIPSVPGISKGEALTIIKEHGGLSAFFKTKEGQKFYQSRITELHRNKELVMLSKKAFPYVENDILFKGRLQGEADCKAFTTLMGKQNKASLF